MRNGTFVVIVQAMLLVATPCLAANPRHWIPEGKLGYPLQAEAIPEPGTTHLRAAFLEPVDPIKSLEKLRTSGDVARAELRAFARGMALEPLKQNKELQPKGRIALVWWDIGRAKVRLSTARKDNTFVPDSDRLVGALAVLDSAAICAGKWVDGEAPTVRLPAKWTKSIANGGFGVTSNLLEGAQAISSALAGEIAACKGNFTPEEAVWIGARGALERGALQWIKDNPRATVTVLLVYTYADKGKHKDRVPDRYRFYAVDSTNTLRVQFTAATVNGRQTTNSDLTIGIR